MASVRKILRWLLSFYSTSYIGKRSYIYGNLIFGVALHEVQNDTIDWIRLCNATGSCEIEDIDVKDAKNMIILMYYCGDPVELLKSRNSVNYNESIDLKPCFAYGDLSREIARSHLANYNVGVSHSVTVKILLCHYLTM